MNPDIRNDANTEAKIAGEHSNKSILARGCDPLASLEASRAIPPIIGYPEYTPTTTDEAFVEQLKTRQWSVVFFAPGACRYSNAGMPIPGGNSETEGWTLAQYRELVRKYQGESVQIVEALDESQTVGLLREALKRAHKTN